MMDSVKNQKRVNAVPDAKLLSMLKKRNQSVLQLLLSKPTIEGLAAIEEIIVLYSGNETPTFYRLGGQRVYTEKDAIIAYQGIIFLAEDNMLLDDPVYTQELIASLGTTGGLSNQIIQQLSADPQKLYDYQLLGVQMQLAYLLRDEIDRNQANNVEPDNKSFSDNKQANQQPETSENTENTETPEKQIRNQETVVIEEDNSSDDEVNKFWCGFKDKCKDLYSKIVKFLVENAKIPKIYKSFINKSKDIISSAKDKLSAKKGDGTSKTFKQCFKALDSWFVTENAETNKDEMEDSSDKGKKEVCIAFIKKFRRALIAGGALLICILLLSIFVISPSVRYKQAMAFYDEADYIHAQSIFDGLGDYKEALDYNIECKYYNAEDLVSNEKYTEAKLLFDEIIDYKQSKQYSNYCMANSLMIENKFVEAREVFLKLNNFIDSKTLEGYCSDIITYYKAQKAYDEKSFALSEELFYSLGAFLDSKEMSEKASKLTFVSGFEHELNSTDFTKYKPETKKTVDYRYEEGFCPEIINPLYYKHIYKIAQNNLYRNKLSDALKNFEILPSDYENTALYINLINAYNDKDYVSYEKYLNEYSESIYKDETMYKDIIGLTMDGFKIADEDSLDEALTSYQFARDYTSISDNGEISNADYVFDDISVDYDTKLAKLCGSAPQGKMLITMYDDIAADLMNRLPIELIPNNAAEVKYILAYKREEIQVGTYTKGTKAMRHKISIVLLSCPSGSVVKTFGTVLGGRPPNSFTYRGSPPGYKFGSKPDYDEAKEIFYDAIKGYMKDSDNMEKQEFEDYTYAVSDDEVTIVEYKGEEKNIVIPDVIDGIPVKYMSPYTFIKNENVEGIILPKSLVKIPNQAFLGCKSLTTINIPDGVTAIGIGAFQDCTSLSKIEIPNSVSFLGDSVFLGCSALTEVALSDSLDEISNYAFKKCSSLERIDFPNGIKEIGDCAFEESGLEEISLNDGIEVIKASAFKSCKSLTSAVMPDSVRSIGSGVFMSCSKLSNVVLSDLIETIPLFAFSGCSSLENIEFSSSLKYIENSSFTSCGFKKIIVPDGVESIGRGVFNNCENLKEVIIPNSVLNLDANNFSDDNIVVTVSDISNAFHTLTNTFDPEDENAFKPRKLNVIPTEIDIPSGFDSSKILDEYIKNENKEYYIILGGIKYTKKEFVQNLGEEEKLLKKPVGMGYRMSYVAELANIKEPLHIEIVYTDGSKEVLDYQVSDRIGLIIEVDNNELKHPLLKKGILLLEKPIKEIKRQ